ncbi:MAG: D-ala-D-ala transporter subunit [Methanosaeta sp. PtaB.Bin039]|nr:MAG: D-ala-D-ala transporter subunit [Methanosaeta sp. PtaB.Bin039]OPY47747.1 MAG: D-ala-D-ala transporter subunit [Methanosaeta sp. PtaU1.Bin028]HOT07725.1 ABC transporter permease [Methanotrichaceae archaeon]HQF17419.1 ABC transporter permease [Methanotrichaceae archaeon]HQI92177.1 ABC transporter permease [Methanotrichaceae archaeon]
MHVDLLGAVLRDPLGMTGSALLGLVTVMAILAPALSGYPPDLYTGQILSPPSAWHPLGTDSVGQDIWSRLLWGARTSLLVGAAVALISTSISVIIGTTTAIFGGLYERFWMRAVDAMLAIPPIIVMILVAAYLRPNLLVLILLLSALSWPGGARICRAQTLSLLERTHLSAAATFGAGWRHIIRRHILPDLTPIMLALTVGAARRAIFMEAGLSFLGVSDPTMVSWGKIMQQALQFTYLDVWRWWLVPTGLALSLTLVSLSLLGFALEGAMDPRLDGGQRHGDTRSSHA